MYIPSRVRLCLPFAVRNFLELEPSTFIQKVENPSEPELLVHF